MGTLPNEDVPQPEMPTLSDATRHDREIEGGGAEEQRPHRH
jgi:hypothetical protein